MYVCMPFVPMYTHNKELKIRQNCNVSASPTELFEAFEAEANETGNERLLLTAAVPVGPDNIRSGYDVPAVSR